MARPKLSAHATSAALQKVDDLKAPLGIPEAWQRDSYGYYEIIGEISYVMSLTAKMVASCDIEPVEADTTVAPDGWKETRDERVLRVWDAFTGPRGGKTELYRRAALHLLVAGESYLVGIPLEDQYGLGAGISWEFLSNEEIRVENGGRTIKRSFGGYAGMQPVELAEDTYLARLWQSDPRFADRADCALKHVLPICREIVVLTQVVDAIAKSRLSAGILFVPDEMSFGPYDETEDDADTTDEIDPFTAELIEQLTAPVEDRTSAASLVPLVMRGPAEFYDKVKLVDVSRNLDALYMNLRQEAIRRLVTGLDVPPEILMGKGGLNHWCVSDDHEVLTRDRGWVTQDALCVGDVVRTLNHDIGLAEWQPVLDIYRADVVDEPMVAIDGDRHSSLTTPSHRWPTLHGKNGSQERIWTTSEKLNGLDSLIVAAPSADQPVEQKWSDSMVELAAWLWTEGHIRFRSGRRSPQVTIWQSNKVNHDNVVRIRRACTAVFGEAAESLGTGSKRSSEPMWVEVVRPDRSGMTEFRFNSVAADILVGLFADPALKVLDSEFVREMTPAQIELFIDASVRADGTVLAGGTIHLAQANRDRLAPIELAATLSGRSTNIYPLASGMTMLSISAKTTFGVAGKRVTDTTYTGTIWCPVTPNKSWFARRNGKTFYTGNTGYNIDSEYIKSHVTPLGEMIAEFITAVYLRPMLVEFEGMTEEEANNYFLLLDTSKISSQMDSGPNARAAYDRKELSADAYLRENGFDESDAPDHKERLERDLRTLFEAEPVVFGIPVLELMYPELKDKIKVPGLNGAPVPPAAPGGVSIPGVPTMPKGDNPTGLPERKNPTGPSVAPIIDKGSGQGEPQPRGPRLSADPVVATEETLLDRLATASDGALEVALERAGSRLISKMNGAHVSLKDQFKTLPKGEVVSNAPESLLKTLGVTPEWLFEGAWDNLAVRGKGWARQHFMDAGIDSFTADEKASMVTNCLVEQLDQMARSALRTPVRVGPNGLRIPAAMVQLSIDQAERIP